MRTARSLRLSIALLAASAVIVFSAAGCAHRVRATGSPLWQLRGVVIAIDEPVLTVRHKTGQIVSVTLDEGTRYSRDREPASIDMLHRGTRVTIDLETLGGVHLARRIQVFGGSR